MDGRRAAFLLVLAGGAGCGQVIGIRDLGVETLPTATPEVEGGTSPPAAASLDAASEKAPDSEACSSPDVAGLWSGKFKPDDGILTGVGDANGILTQDCTAILGTMSVSSCVSGGTVAATIDESGHLHGTITANGIVISIDGTLSSPNHLEGTFATTQTGLGCFLHGGTFQLDR